MKKNPICVRILGHLLTILALTLFFIGCLVIGYMAWILSSSVSIEKFKTGTLIVTYITIGIGFGLFFSGLIGCVAGASETTWAIRLYIIVIILFLISLLGGILAIKIARIDLDDILKSAWNEGNQNTRNLVQIKLNCCGFLPNEYVYNNYHMDLSCYEKVNGEKQLKKKYCKAEIKKWFEENPYIWISFLASILVIKLVSVLVSFLLLILIGKHRRQRQRNESRSSSKRQLYDKDNFREYYRESL